MNRGRVRRSCMLHERLTRPLFISAPVHAGIRSLELAQRHHGGTAARTLAIRIVLAAAGEAADDAIRFALGWLDSFTERLSQVSTASNARRGRHATTLDDLLLHNAFTMRQVEIDEVLVTRHLGKQPALGAVRLHDALRAAITAQRIARCRIAHDAFTLSAFVANTHQNSRPSPLPTGAKRLLFQTSRCPGPRLTPHATRAIAP